MASVFRGKMRSALRKRYDRGAFTRFGDFDDPEAFGRLMNRLGGKKWYVYAKRSFGRAKHVTEYLGRYTHRVALSNSRILNVSGDRVILRTRGKGRAVMSPADLLSRFVRHVLPKSFHKIRHCGLYASTQRARRAPFALPQPPSPLNFAERLQLLTGRDISRCPRCEHPLVSQALPEARAPPRAAA